jgi:HAD superfamily hydrolase (TIGR01549 family)
MNKIRLVLFDVDGVLLDSLLPHLKICEDKNIEYKLGLNIPSPAQLKEIARNKIQISPMKYFFLAVGFPEEFAEKANIQYNKVFMQRYAPAPFAHVHKTLKVLHDWGLRLGIVTSNVRPNIVAALGSSIDYFDPGLIFCKDDSDLSKAAAISGAMKKAQTSPAETLYVGDQSPDWDAAKAAGTNFLGVTYGWGISEEDRDKFPIVPDVGGIAAYILPRTEPINQTGSFVT